MALHPGDRLGPYTILNQIGEGGMGEVYRARDAALERDVAIKVLPAAMADNPKRLMRFSREARALAALNHPAIAAVYAVEDRAIVMEMVDGEDLTETLRRGPIALETAIVIACQVADALRAAHDQGIVHRDLKPANIRIRPDGSVKVLDFGLAKMRDLDEAPAAADVNDATVTIDATRDGATIGTAAYMAPEQARGEPVDRRADIWAFGVVLFEMLAGHKPFRGANWTETLAAVLTHEPDWSILPADTPAAVRRVLRRCLTKAPMSRLQDITDARLELLDTRDDQREASLAPVPRARRWREAVLWAVLGASVVIASALTVWPNRSVPPAPIRATVDLAPAQSLSAGGVHPDIVLPAGGARTALAWTPDGRALVYIGVRDSVRQIYIRDMHTGVSRIVEGSTGAVTLAVSPDSRRVAFWADNEIRTVAIAGGPPVRVGVSEVTNGLNWGTSRLLFARSGDIVEVSPDGGGQRIVAQPPDLVRYSTPFLLPGDRTFLYTEYRRQWTSGDEWVMARPIDNGTAPKALVQGADARYLPTGHLAFLRRGILFVAPFDPVSLTFRGEATALVSGISQATAAWDSDDLTLAGQFALAETGALAYVPADHPRYPISEIVRVNRRGMVTKVDVPARSYRSPVVLSPTGDQLAVSIQDDAITAHVLDLTRGTLARLARDESSAPVREHIVTAWSPAGIIAVGRIDEGRMVPILVDPRSSLFPVEVPGGTGMWPSDLDRAGRLIGMRNGGLWVATADATKGPPWQLAVPTRSELQPQWSPDGRWVAYSTDTTGQSEVYIRQVAPPHIGAAHLVSTRGGRSPAWHPNGRELFYLESTAQEERMMAVRVDTEGRTGAPTRLFAYERGRLFTGTPVLTPYAVARDGQSFFGVRPLKREDTPISTVHLFLHWLPTLGQR